MKKARKKKSKSLQYTDDEKGFWLHKGPVLHSLEELYLTLPELTKEQFSHHVNKKRNDFSNWVEGVFGDKKLALRIKKLRTKNSILKAIDVRLKGLKAVAG